jgi:phosphoglycerate dehydrogenase-like enzyme
MKKRQLTIFSNAAFNEAAMSLLVEATKDHQLVTDGDDCSHADVAFGHPEPEQIIDSTCLQWVHIISAGYTPYDTDAMRVALSEHGTLLTNSSHVYDAPCAQHVLAMMMAKARQLLPSYDNQRSAHDWNSGTRREASYLLNGQTVVMLGMGAIGRYLIRLLQPFDMQIIAVRRNAQQQDVVEVIGEEALADVLPRADHIVNVLPGNPSTIGFMNAARFGLIKRGARFYNVGRGSTVDQESLLECLQSGQLGAAYLDVTDPEPLPVDHPLWTAPNCFITPHTAGGHQDEEQHLVQHFVKNLRAFEAGEPLIDRILGT